jgi:hypothetical protein
VLAVTYNVDTARRLPRPEDKKWNGTDLHVMCDGKIEMLDLAQLSNYGASPEALATQQTSVAQASSATNTQPSDATTNPPPFEETLTITFFGHPANMADPIWWRDATEYDNSTTKTDHLVAGDIYPEAVEGAKYLGHMKFTHIPSAERLYNYQAAPKPDEKDGRVKVSSLLCDDINADQKGCVFNVMADPSVILGVAIDKIHYYVEGEWMGAMKSGKPVEIDQSKIKDLIKNSCKELSLEDGKAEKDKPLT